MFGFGKRSGSMKKALSEDDGFELDFDFGDDLRGMDDGFGFSDDYNSNKKSRSPALNATKDFTKGLSKSVVSPSGMQTLIKSLLPSAYGEFLDTSVNAKNSLTSSFQEATSSLGSVKKQTQDLLRRAAPMADQNGLNKLASLLTKVGGKEDNYEQEGHSKEQQRDQEIGSTLGSLFSVQNKINTKKEAIRDKKDEAKMALDAVRFQDQYGALTSIDSTLRQGMLFDNKNTFNFYRKSIELGIRKLHVLSDILLEQKTANKSMLEAVNDIKLNTGLPDYAKMHNLEHGKQQLKQKFFNSSTDYITNLTESIGNQLKGYIGDFSDFFGELSNAGEMLLDAEEMNQDMGMSGSKAERLGGVPMSLMGMFGDRLRKRSIRGLKGTKYGDKILGFGNRLGRFQNNMGDELVGALSSDKIQPWLLKMLGTDDGTGNKEENRITGGIGRILDFFLGHARNANEKARSVQIDNLNQDYGQFSSREGQQSLTNKSLNVVIPGYLARILREVASIRSGKEEELLEYDHIGSRFQRSSAHAKDLLQRAAGSSVSDAVSRSGIQIIDQLELRKRNNIGKMEFDKDWSKEDSTKIGNILAMASLNGTPINDEFFQSERTWISLGSKKAKLLAERFKKMRAKDDDEGSEELNRLIRDTVNLKSSISPNVDSIRGMVSMGHHEHLLRQGLFDKEGNIDPKAFITLLKEGKTSAQDLGSHYGFSDDYLKNTGGKVDSAFNTTNQKRFLDIASRRYRTSNMRNAAYQTPNDQRRGIFDVMDKINGGHSSFMDSMTVEELKQMGSYSTGGWTGRGKKDELAGVVHREEYVLNKDNVEAMGGKSGVERLIAAAKNMFKSASDSLSSTSTNLMSSFQDDGKKPTGNLGIIARNTEMTSLVLQEISTKLDTLQMFAMAEGTAANAEGNPMGRRWYQVGNEFFRKVRAKMSGSKSVDPEVQKKTVLQSIGSNALWLAKAVPLFGIKMGWDLSKFGFNTAIGAMRLPGRLLGLGKKKEANDNSTEQSTADFIQSLNTRFDSVKEGVKKQKDKLSEEFQDVYQKGLPEPVLKKKDFLLGKYKDQEGKVIRKWADIKGHIYDEDGNIAMDWEEFKNGIIRQKDKPIAINTRAWFKDHSSFLKKAGLIAAAGVLAGPAGIVLAGGGLYAYKKFTTTNVRDKLSNKIAEKAHPDVYIVGDRKPVLYGKFFKENYYYDTVLEDFIHKATDIVGPIVSIEKPGQILVTEEDIERGLIDVFGTPIENSTLTTNLKRGGASAVGAVMNLAGKAIGLGFKGAALGVRAGIGAVKLGASAISSVVSGTAKITGGFFRGIGTGYSSVYDKLVGRIRDTKDGVVASLALTNETNRYLYGIYKLLDKRLPRPVSVFGDVDGDGLRENGIQDVKRKRAEKMREAIEAKKNEIRDSKLATKIAKAMDKRRGKDSDKDDDEDSFIDEIISGVTGAIGAKILSLFGGGDPASIGGDMIMDGADGKDKKGKGGKKAKARQGRFAKMRGALGRTRAGRMATAATGALGATRAGQALGNASTGMINGGRFVGSKMAPAMGMVGGAAKLGLRGLGAAGMLYSGYSLANNLSEGNYGDAAIDAGFLGVGALTSGVTLAGAGAAISGTASVIGAGLTAIGPVGWAILGLGAAAYGGYKLFKWIKNTRINDNVKARLMAYGFNPDDDKDKAKKVMELERMISEALKFDANGKALIDDSQMEPKKILDIFDLKIDDNIGSHRFVEWFQYRFVPVFTKAVEALRNMKESNTIQDAYSLKGEDLLKYLNAILPTDSIQAANNTSPFNGETLSVSIGDAKSFIQGKIDGLEKQKTANGGKLDENASLDNPTGEKGLWDKTKDLAKLTAGIMVPGYGMKMMFDKMGLDKKLPSGGDLFDATKKGAKFGPLGMMISTSFTVMKSLLGGNDEKLESNVSVDGKDGNLPVDGFVSILYKAYGLYSLTDQEKVATLRKVEAEAAKLISITGSKVIFNDEVTKLVAATFNFFGIEEGDENRLAILKNYYQYRFIPVFLNAVAAVNRINNSTNLQSAFSFKPADKMIVALEVVNTTSAKGSIWNYKQTPWPAGDLNGSKASTDGDIALLKKSVEEKGSSDSKTKAIENQEKQSQSLGSRMWDAAKNTMNFITNPLGTIAKKADGILTENSDTYRQVKQDTSDFTQGAWDKVNNMMGSVTGSQREMGLAVYSSLRSAGFSHNQARVLTAEIGRENSWQAKNIFGYHNDPHSGVNLGMISWQGVRGRRLEKFLRDRGLLGNGGIVRSIEGLKAQAEFLMDEMKTTHNTKPVQDFLNSPNIELNQGMDLIGKHFIKWRITDPDYREGGIRNRNHFLAALDDELKKHPNATKGTGAGGAMNKMAQGNTEQTRKVMQGFSQARLAIINNNSMSEEEKKTSLAHYDKLASQYSLTGSTSGVRYDPQAGKGGIAFSDDPSQAKYDYDQAKPESGGGIGKVVGGSTPPGKAINWLRANGDKAHTILKKSKGGNCAATIGLALFNAGYLKTERGHGHAYNYVNVLSSLGWVNVTNRPYQAGDIAVCMPNPRGSSDGARKYGHVSMFDGNLWITDIKCASPIPYKNRNTAGYTVHVFRDPKYMGGVAVDEPGSYKSGVQSIKNGRETPKGKSDLFDQVDISAGAGKFTPGFVNVAKDSNGLIADQNGQYRYDGIDHGSIGSNLDKHTADLQGALRRLLNMDASSASSIKNNLASTKEARATYQEEINQPKNIINRAMDVVNKVTSSVDITNDSKKSAKTSVDKAMELVNVSNEILKENKAQTKVLTDILEAIRKDNKNIQPKDRVSYQNQIQSDYPINVSRSPVNVAKQS